MEQTWVILLAAFGGATVGAFLGNYLFPLLLENQRSPRLKLEPRDDKILSHDGFRVIHRLIIKNEGKSAARNCEATIKLKNVTQDVVIDGYNTTLKAADFGQRNLLEDPNPVCWSYSDNPARLTLNPRVPYHIDLFAFLYKGLPIDPGSSRPSRSPEEDQDLVMEIQIPSELGWSALRVVLKPARYVVWAQVSGENCEPSNELRFWIRHKGDPQHLEVSFTPD